jgi:hypothetical protein
MRFACQARSAFTPVPSQTSDSDSDVSRRESGQPGARNCQSPCDWPVVEMEAIVGAAAGVARASFVNQG